MTKVDRIESPSALYTPAEAIDHRQHLLVLPEQMAPQHAHQRPGGLLQCVEVLLARAAGQGVQAVLHVVGQSDQALMLFEYLLAFEPL